MKQILLSLFVIISFSGFSQEVVELGRYSSMQPESKFQGIEDVRFMVMSDGSHRYFVETGDFQAVFNQARALGINATQGDLTGMNCLCTGAPRVTVAELSKIRNLFFGFDSAALTSESKSQLRAAARILNQNPGYSIQFRGYTDSKGSQEYNQALSERRVASADKYLKGLGINSSRIRKQAFSENSPIAKNTDSDAGRKFNRRVEIQIYDQNGNPLNMVDPINVPTHLRN